MLSIVIPTFNRSTYLRPLLESILRQTLEMLEVIIVDNGPSTDNTQAVVQQYSEKIRINYILTKVKGTVFAKNIGWRKAQGDIILFLDDDVELIELLTIRLLIQTFQDNKEFGIIGGLEKNDQNQMFKKMPHPPKKTTGRISELGEFNSAFYNFKGYGIHEVDHVRSAFMAVKKNLLEKIHGFDEHYNANGDDFRAESDVCMRIKKLGYKVVVHPDIEIWHKGAVRTATQQRNYNLKNLHYRNRNHIYFMLKNIWKKGKFNYFLSSIKYGDNATPGFYYFFVHLKNDRDLRWFGYIIACITGKIAGVIHYYRYVH